MSAKTKTTKPKQSREEEIKLPPSEYRKMVNFDRRVERRNAANHKRLVLAIAELIADDPYVEFRIVSRYLKRKNMMMVDRPENEMTASRRPELQSKRDRPSRSL